MPFQSPGFTVLLKESYKDMYVFFIFVGLMTR